MSFPSKVDESRAGIVQKSSIPITIPLLPYWFLNDTFFDTNFVKPVLTQLQYTLAQVSIGFIYLFMVYFVYFFILKDSPEPLRKRKAFNKHNKSVQIDFKLFSLQNKQF